MYGEDGAKFLENFVSHLILIDKITYLFSTGEQDMKALRALFTRELRDGEIFI
jgi:hypothetical protein